MKKLGILLTLLVIFIVQGSSLCAMKRSQKDTSPLAHKTRKDETPFTYPNVQDLSCYQMLLSLLGNPSQEGFKVKAAYCINGCSSLIQAISSKIKHTENKSKLLEIKEAFLGKLLELREQLNPIGIDEVISQLERFSISS